MAERRPFPLVPFLLLSGVFLYAFHHLFHILVPFLLSLALAYVANPVISYFETWGLKRNVTVLAVYAVIAVSITLLANNLIDLVGSELASLQAQAPAYYAKGQQYLKAGQLWVARRVPVGSDLVAHWDAKLYAPVLKGAQNIPAYLLGVFPLLSFIFLIPFITFFLLIDGSRSIESLIQTMPSRYVEQALHLVSEVDASLGNYLRGILIVAAAITTASFVGLVLLGVDQALAIAVLSGVSSFVPYLGAAIGAVVGGLTASIQFGSALAGLKVVLLFVGIRVADEALLQPVIARHSVHLHPLVFLLSLMVGGELFGFLGLVFAVPVACILKALLKVGWSWYATEARLKALEPAEAPVVPYL